MPLPQPLLFAAAAAALAAHPLPAKSPAVAAYEHELARQCPAKHLEWLNPGILADPVDEFAETLPKRTRSRVAARVNADCAKVEAGASCGDYAAIRAIHDLGRTRALAAKVCAEAYSCTAPFECRQTGAR